MDAIKVSSETYSRLVKFKEEFGTSTLSDTLEKLLENYKALLKKISLKKLLELNEGEAKTDINDLLEDRKRYR